MKSLFAILLMASLSSPAWPQDEPLSIEGLALRNARLLVAGVAYGFWTFDSELEADGKQRFYCAPQEVDISGNYLWELADAELDGDHDLATVAATVLRRLKTLYPCAS